MPTPRFLLISFLCFFCTYAENVFAEELHIAVASNFLSTLDLLKPVYEEQTGDTLIISSGSTGSLYSQIINGAPYDVFLSADEERAILLQNTLDPGKPLIPYAYGKLVLWHPQVDHTKSKSWQSLINNGNFRSIALANPALAPYGKAALEVIDGLENTDLIKNKMVLGQNIGQAYTMIATGNAEIGFVALSQLLDNPESHSMDYYQIIPEIAYLPIRQCVVQISTKEQSRKFLTFLTSNTAREIISSAGYGVPEL